MSMPAPLSDPASDSSIDPGHAALLPEPASGPKPGQGLPWAMLQLLAAQLHPCLLALELDGRVQAIHGDAAHYGLQGLVTGSDARERLAFLHGLDLRQPQRWPLLALAPEVYADVTISANPGAAVPPVLVLLSDCAQAYAGRQSTQQHANEVALLNRRLQQTLAALERARAELEQRHHELDRLNRLKDRVIAGLSHELRTPLTGIVGHLELLRAHSPPAAAASLAAIEAGTAHLLSLVSNILDQASIDGEQMILHPAPTELQRLFNDCASLLAPMAERRGLDFRLQQTGPLPQWVSTDATRLRQVLFNLTTNAIKYTPAGLVELCTHWTPALPDPGSAPISGSVSDAVSGPTPGPTSGPVPGTAPPAPDPAARAAPGWLEVRVSDSGPGVPAEVREGGFMPYRRGPGAAGEGLGLGLALSAQIVALLGGQLQLRDRPGGGSVFWFRIPLDAQPGPLARGAGGGAGGTGARVLLLEDAPELRLLYEALLRVDGYRVSVSAEVDSALAQCLANPPDILITDLYLGRGDSVELIRRLRARGFAGIIITWSASALGRDRDRLLAAGADLHLVKPVSAAVLRETLRSLQVGPGRPRPPAPATAG